MTIVVDENIPLAARALARFGRLRALSGRSITPEDLRDAEALVVRSVTRVDRALLEGTAVRFVGTATIGTDHIDLDYLAARGIAFADAAGSNARSVAEYVMAALLELEARGLASLDGEEIGIIGVGNVGSLVAAMAPALGLRPVLHDPPRAAREPGFRSASLEEALACRIVTLHVPLESAGPYPTRGLVDARFLSRMRPDGVLLNTARGGVADSAALLDALDRKRPATAVLDVWREEPAMPRELMERCALATPHIAGYSYDGKVRGTEMMATALARALGSDEGWSAREALPPVEIPIDLRAMADPRLAVAAAVRAAYDIAADDRRLRAALSLDADARRVAFDRMRKEYPMRREFPAHVAMTEDVALAARLRLLGFNVAGGPAHGPGSPEHPPA